MKASPLLESLFFRQITQSLDDNLLGAFQSIGANWRQVLVLSYPVSLVAGN